MRIDIWEKDPQFIQFTSDYIFRDKDILMTVPGARYRTKENAFVAPLGWGVCQAARGIFGADLEIGPALLDWALAEAADRVQPALALRTAVDADGDSRLYPFQRAGVKFLRFAGRALLADEMGTGKTVQALTALREEYLAGEQIFPAIVIAPNNMLLTWQKEMAVWFPEATSTVIKGTAAKREALIKQGADFLIINWEGVRGHSRLAPYGSLRLKRCYVCNPNLEKSPTNSPARCEACPGALNGLDFKTIVLDEAHRMKDPRSKQSRATRSLSGDSVSRVLALTGTPIADGPEDLWSALNMVAPGDWPTRDAFITRYCSTYMDPWAGHMQVMGLRHDTAQEFFRVLDPRMRRMPKEVVLPELPKKVYSTRYVEMTPKQAKAYRQMSEQMVTRTESGELMLALDPLTKLTRLSQVASAMADIDPEGNVVLSNPSCKVNALVEILEELGSEPAVVFAESLQLIKLAAAKMDALGITYSMIIGGQSITAREAAKEAFQAGRVRLILCTIKAAKEGITLTRAGTAIFLNRSWSNVDNIQAENRVHRIGSESHDKVQIIGIEAIGTVEEGQQEALLEKGERLEEIVRDRLWKG